MEEPIIYEHGKHSHLIQSLVDIHKDCILIDGTMATFLPPLDNGKMISFWEAYATNTSTCTIIMQLIEGDVAGCVVLKDNGSETGPFRAEVLKLLVSPRYRQRGVAKRIMRKLEEVAELKGLTQLFLDTTVGTPAEHIYPRLGYQTIGIIRQNGILPKDGSLADEILFYKNLPSHGQKRLRKE